MRAFAVRPQRTILFLPRLLRNPCFRMASAASSGGSSSWTWSSSSSSESSAVISLDSGLGTCGLSSVALGPCQDAGRSSGFRAIGTLAAFASVPGALEGAAVGAGAGTAAGPRVPATLPSRLRVAVRASAHAAGGARASQFGKPLLLLAARARTRLRFLRCAHSVLCSLLTFQQHAPSHRCAVSPSHSSASPLSFAQLRSASPSSLPPLCFSFSLSLSNNHTRSQQRQRTGHVNDVCVVCARATHPKTWPPRRLRAADPTGPGGGRCLRAGGNT